MLYATCGHLRPLAGRQIRLRGARPLPALCARFPPGAILLGRRSVPTARADVCPRVPLCCRGCRFDQKAAQLAKVEASADQVLDDFLANMKRVRQLKLDEMPKIAVGPIGMSDNHNPVYEALKKGKLPDPTSDLIKVVGSRSPPPNKLAASPRQTSVAVA